MEEPEEPPHCPECGHLGTRSGPRMPLSYAVRRTSSDGESSFRCNQCYNTFSASAVEDRGWVAAANSEVFEAEPPATETVEDFAESCDCSRCENDVTYFDALD